MKHGKKRTVGKQRSPGARRRPRDPARSPAPPPGLFRDILLAPDRDLSSGAAPVVSWREEDDPAFSREVDRRVRLRVTLRRRGRDHGDLAELEPAGLVPPRPRRRRREALLSERWCAARPIVVPGAAAGAPGDVARRSKELYERLARPPALAAWLAEATEEVPWLRVVDRDAERFDPERDLERVALAAQASGSELDDLWLKTGRLSTDESDASLRLRVSFGREEDDDASDDEARHDTVGRIARRLLPGAAWLEEPSDLRDAIEARMGHRARFTQHIAYWNAPGGGALFHHDAFAGPESAEGEPGQRGVLYVQLTGRTAWLALSLADLAQRVREFAGWLEDDELAYLEEELFPDRTTRDEVHERMADWRLLQRELALPGCGLLGPLVNRGPEFTSFLADAGHAALLHPGDAILLPNHGLERTAMHSVFAASPRPGYALSVAIRAGDPLPAQSPGGSSGAAGTGVGTRRGTPER